MGHRALVARERGADEYALHYSHWGADGLGLAGTLASTTHFDGDDPDERVDPDERGDTDERVDPEPLATGLSRDAILAEHLDFQVYEAFYVVDREGRVTAHLPLWLGLADACRSVEGSATVGNGTLVAVRGPGVEPADPGRVRTWFRGTKGTVGWLVDDGRLPAAEVTATLVERVRERFPDREVIVVAPD